MTKKERLMSDSPHKPEQQDLPNSIELDDNIAENPQQQKYDFLSTDENSTAETSEQKPNKTKKTALIIGALILIAGGAFAYLQLGQQETSPPPPVEQKPATPSVAPEVAPPAPQATTVPVVEEKVLIEENVLTQPVAEDISLQEEEIAKLSEIEKQLAEQKSNLEAQSQDVDELIRLKEEQIKLLEAELAKKQVQ